MEQNTIGVFQVHENPFSAWIYPADYQFLREVPYSLAVAATETPPFIITYGRPPRSSVHKTITSQILSASAVSNTSLYLATTTTNDGYRD